MDTDPTLQTLITARTHLTERLGEVRSELDSCIHSYTAEHATVATLARLDGLMEQRRELVSRLIKQDDEILDHMVALLGKKAQA